MAHADTFSLAVLAGAVTIFLALASSTVTRYVPFPVPALLLLAASVAATAIPRVGRALTVTMVEQIATTALIFVLFDGGMQVGMARIKKAIKPILNLGLLGTLLTAGGMALAAHAMLGGSWAFALLLATALAPTDPAVMFSVLGAKEVAGRSGTILEGESGANDPVSIALMVAVLAVFESAGGSPWSAAGTFFAQLLIGLAVGLAGGRGLQWAMRHRPLERAGLPPLRTLAGAGAIYGVASLLAGSGFLAVFAAGIVLGDARAPHKEEIVGFHNSLANLSEVAAFVALGLTVPIGTLLAHWIWAWGLALAAVLALVVRPLAIAPLLALARLTWGERMFICWAGLKGAVPILLAAYARTAHVAGGRRLYELVFVVVTASVLVQGASVPGAARLFNVPMRTRLEGASSSLLVARRRVRTETWTPGASVPDRS